MKDVLCFPHLTLCLKGSSDADRYGRQVPTSVSVKITNCFINYKVHPYLLLLYRLPAVPLQSVKRVSEFPKKKLSKTGTSKQAKRKLGERQEEKGPHSLL